MLKSFGKFFKEKPIVLIVDDDPAVTESLKQILKEGGYRVETASDGEEALTIARQVRPNLIILDINMPGLPGDVVAMRITSDEDLRGTPVIIVTAYDSFEEKVFAAQAGAVDYVVKPYDPQKLLDKIGKLLEKKT